MIGQTINHYKITEKLGAGGMGEVFLASDTKLDRQVALKFLPERLTRDPEAHERLLREAQAASRLNHPNILTIYSVEEDGNRVFIVMEYVDGLQLDDYMRERKPRLDEILGVAIGIAGGLAKAHQAGITHRDLKPGNILIDTDERVKILDFGLAKLEGASKLTRTGSTLGTVSYMSPEQGRGDHTDSRSDLFSFGVVLYEMITGQPAFGGEHEAAILYASANDEPEPLARFKADVPDELQRIVTKCLAKRPADRYQSAADLLTDLKTMQRSLSPLSTVTTTGGYSPQRKRTGLVISASALAMIVLAVLIFKPWKIVVEPTQEAAAVQNLLAVMYFDNLSDPDDAGRLGEIAANLLITDLSESQYVQVVSSQRLFDLLNLLGHTGDKRIDRATATEVARKAQARWMLMGSLLKTEPNIVLTAQLVEVETGNAVASQRINGESGEDIFALVDRLTIEVKSDLSLPYESTSESDLVIADGTTHSTEAYRYYLSGVENAQRFYWQEAKQDFLNAVERDSTFAMAYLYLSWYEQGTRAEIEEWTATALRHSKDIPQKDRWYIEAQSRYMMHDVEASNALLERLVAKYPDEKMAYMGLAYAHRDNGKYEEAIAALQRVVAIDPAYGLAYNLMAYTYDEMDDFDNSITAINKYIELAPNEANPYDTRGDLYAYNGKLKQAVASFRDALARKPDFYPSLRKIGQVALLQRNYSLADSCFAAMSASDDEKTRSEGRTSLALIPAYQGRFADALLLLDDALAADRLEQYEGSPHAMKLRVKTVLLQELGRYTETITLWRTNTDAMYRINPTDVVGFMPWIAALHARSGEFEEADSILTVLHENILARDSSQIYGYWYGKAAVALARGDAAAAIEATRNNTGWQLEYWVHQQRAQAYLALGQPAEAIPPIEKYLGRFDKAGVYDPGLMIGAHYLLGQAYEQSGWTDKAIEKYELFLEIWKDADPEILMVQDAEERLARLTNES